jgi:hypothetical protein
LDQKLLERRTQVNKDQLLVHGLNQVLIKDHRILSIAWASGHSLEAMIGIRETTLEDEE